MHAAPDLAHDATELAADPVPERRLCANVECHLVQTSVTWGKPYRWGATSECDSCHGYGY